MIPISQLHYFLHYRKFSLLVTLAITAVAQINPVQAASREDTNTLNLKSESVSTDALSQNIKPLKKELLDIAQWVNKSDSEELSDKFEDATFIQLLKASKRNYRLTSRLDSRRNSLLPEIASNRITKSTKNYISERANQLNPTIPDAENISDPELLATDNLTDINRENTENNLTEKKLLQAQNTSEQDVQKIINQLDAVKDIEIPSFFYSPGFSIYVPTGFGGDRNTGFVSASYQERGRFSDIDDVGLGFGVGLGDSQKAVGVELSYTLASFGRNRDFGSGGFNVKVHRQLPGDWGVAVGWNGFLNIGDENNFEQSLYGVATKIIRTQEKLDSPFSRVAVTLGVGGGQFRTEDAVFDGDDEISVFGSVAVRAVKSASIIAEWTGQDLGIGVSVAPFPNIPLVITPALRDITGAGDGTRFVLGTGFSFKF